VIRRAEFGDRSPIHERGTTTLELVFAVAVLMVGLLGYSRSLVQSVNLGQANREMAIATEAARRALEQVSSVPFDEAFARYNTDPADDPDGPGSAAGSIFGVVGLDLRWEDINGVQGEILFPTDGGGLRENVDHPDLGPGRDLNLDGVIDAADHSTDYRVLPVLVRVAWRSGMRTNQIEMQTIVCER